MAINVATRDRNGAAPIVAPPISETDRELLVPWIRRRDQARTDRRRYEHAWSVSQFFAAGIQWLASEQATGRIMEDPNARDKRGRPLDVVDVLSQYCGTVIGKLAQGDMRPELLSLYDNDAQADLYTEQLNAAVGFAWDEECKADKRFLAILRTLVELGTAGIRCRVDRVSGKLIAPEWPHANGQPLLGDGEAQQHMDQMYTAGLPVDMRPLREAKLALEKLSPWNILPPPGIEDPGEWPWELIVRPVHIPELKMVYGSKASGVTADRIEDMGMLAYSVQRYNLSNSGMQQPAVVSGLKEHALTYTGYRRPDNEYPSGETVVFTHDGHLLDRVEALPYTQSPWGPRSGITYFRWGILEGRFWGRSFMEPGIGPQKIRNKRSSQIDLTIDSGQNKIFVEEGSIDTSKLKGVPNEIVKVKPGATMPKSDGGIQPGAWMQADLELQDTNIQKALGIYGVGLGENPQAVTTYGQLALLNENESTKFGPIAQDFKLNVCDVVRDMIEAMKQWPADKQILIAGDENKLRALAFNAKAAIPAAYLVRPTKQGLPRSEGAELQKVTDIMNQAVATGAAVQQPAEWLAWYVQSLNEGKAEEIPNTGLGVEQRRKAALENVVMVHTGQVLPVAPEDDAQIHVTEHDEEIVRLQETAAQGDQVAGHLIQVIEQHKQLHLEQAQQNAGRVQSSLPPQGPAPGPPGSPAPMPPGASPAGGLPASTPGQNSL